MISGGVTCALVRLLSIRLSTHAFIHKQLTSVSHEANSPTKSGGKTANVSITSHVIF